jgi:outer membrane protein
MMILKHTTLLALLLLSTGIFAQNKKWTLQECVNYALEHNITIQQTILDVEQNELNKKDAIGAFLPNLNASGNHSWNIGLNQNITTGLLENITTQFTSLNLSSNVTLYNGLRNLNQLHRSNLSILASQYRLADIKDDISLFVVNAFLQILFNREQLKVQKAQYDIANNDLERTQELVNQGVLPKGDALELIATLASAEQQIVNIENTLLLSKINLAQTLLLDDYNNFDIVDIDYELPITDVLKEDPEVVLEKAQESRYDLKIAEANVKIAEYDLKLAKGRLYPELSGFYGYNTRASYSDRILGTERTLSGTNSVIGFVEGTEQNVLSPNFVTNRVVGAPDNLFNQFSLNDGHSFGLRLNVPIFNGFSVKNSVKRNRINLERSKNQYNQVKLDLETEVYQAINDAKGALKAYEAAIKTEEARREAFNYSRERYNIGLSNSFQFSQSQSQYEQSKSQVIRFKYDYIFKLRVLEFYFGIPIVD